jgi:hypothetical protein
LRNPFFGDSYAALTLLIQTGASVAAMRTQRRTTVIVVGGALAIASVGYGLGTQADDGTAIADSNQGRNGGTAQPFDRGAPPGLGDLADALGVDQDKLQRAFGAFGEQEHAEREEQFSAALAKELGISSERVAAALEAIRPKFLGSPDGPPHGSPGRALKRHEAELSKFLADRFDLDADKVSKALAANRPPLMSRHHRGLPDHPPAP